MVDIQERNALRALASRWMEHAANPVMAERRRLWRAVKDLKMERPVILDQTGLEGTFDFTMWWNPQIQELAPSAADATDSVPLCGRSKHTVATETRDSPLSSKPYGSPSRIGRRSPRCKIRK